MFQDKEKVLDLIRKCLNLANNNPNEHEASLAMERANELLEKYNLSMAQVKIENCDDTDLIECTVKCGRESWIASLYNIVALNNYCYCVDLRGDGGVSVLGRMANVEAVIEMTQWFKQQVERIASTEMLHYKQTEFINGRIVKHDSPRSYKNAFLHGIVTRINKRLQESKRNRSTDNIYAVAQYLDKEANDFAHCIFPHLVNVKHHIGSTAGYHNGYKAGDDVSMIKPSDHISTGTLRLGSGK